MLRELAEEAFLETARPLPRLAKVTNANPQENNKNAFNAG